MVDKQIARAFSIRTAHTTDARATLFSPLRHLHHIISYQGGTFLLFIIARRSRVDDDLLLFSRATQTTGTSSGWRRWSGAFTQFTGWHLAFIRVARMHSILRSRGVFLFSLFPTLIHDTNAFRALHHGPHSTLFSPSLPVQFSPRGYVRANVRRRDHGTHVRSDTLNGGVLLAVFVRSGSPVGGRGLFQPETSFSHALCTLKSFVGRKKGKSPRDQCIILPVQPFPRTRR